ncbi:MAG: DUF559 domain-containing protein [Mycetocola sp.]
MPRHSALPDDLSGRAFRTTEDAASALSRGRLRGNDLVAPFHGIRRLSTVEGSPIADYLPRMRPGHYFSGVSAAQIHDLYLPTRLETSGTVHVTAISPARAPRTTGVAARQVEPGRITVGSCGAVPVISPVDTWCELAELLTVEELVEMGDGLVRRVRPLATMDELSDAVGRSTGRRGSRNLRAAFARVRPGTDSRQETRLRLYIVDAGLPEPLVNDEIRDRRGFFLALGDLVYPEWKVLVEYDGSHHFASEQQGHHDVDRLDLLMADGWRVVRVHREHMPNRAATRIRTIRAALARAGWTPD